MWPPSSSRAGSSASPSRSPPVTTRTSPGTRSCGPATVNALSLWQQPIKEGLAPRKLLGTGGNDVTANLVSGYTALFNSGIWGVAMLRGAPNFPAGVFRLPVPPGGSYTTTLGGWAFVVNAKGKNPEAAARFVTW